MTRQGSGAAVAPGGDYLLYRPASLKLVSRGERTMFDRALEELIATGGGASVGRWISLLRAAPQAKALKSLSDDELSSIYVEMGDELGRWLSGSSDKNDLGGFFAQVGREYSVQGIPLSELSLALALARKATVRRLVEEGLFDSANAIYAMLDASERVADFYAIGNFYLTKGFLEATIIRISATTSIPKSTMVEYFRDDLFYKD